MSRIDDLIAEHCPDGVRFERLGALAAIRTGSRPAPETVSPSGEFDFFNGGVASSGKVSETNTDARTITIPSRGSVGVVAYQGRPFWCGPLCYRISADSSQILIRFLYYSLKAQEVAIIALQQTGSIPALNKKELVGIRVPVPPFEVQREIVRILDTFTALEAELEAELEARSRQFNHYRDRLLTSTMPRHSWRKMGDAGEFVRGRRFTKSDVVASGIPSIHYGEIYTHYGVSAAVALSQVSVDLFNQLRFASTGDVVVAAVGETVEDVGKAVAWLGHDPVAIHDDTFMFRGHGMDPIFVSYFFQTADFHAQKNQHVARAKVKRLSGAALATIQIPTPPLEVQAGVVAALRSFEALVNDVSIGIPAELAARRRQYEHYRDRLLTFEELVA